MCRYSKSSRYPSNPPGRSRSLLASALMAGNYTIVVNRVSVQLKLTAVMNEVEVAKVKELWGSTDGTWRTAEWLRWLQHPKVRERINILTTGHPEKDRYQYFLERYAPKRLGRATRVKRALTLGCGHGELERGFAKYHFAEVHEG